MHSLYKVPIIPLNLRKEETIVQIAEVIQYLSDITEDIIKRVNDRIEINNKQLANISERIDVASNKISSLAGAKGATQVFSSSKYPAAHVNRQYCSVFADGEPLEITRHKVKCKSETAPDEQLDTLQFYHVKIRKQMNKGANEGLGHVPKDIQSLNDMLLYNTGKNPYRKYEMSDTLKIAQKRREDENTTTSEIGAAPLSISERAALTKVPRETYFYSPNLGEVPTIDVPLDLPDLPGIADDLRFVNNADLGIAPSVTTTPNIPDLPNLPDISTDTSTEPIPSDIVLPPPPPLPPVVPEVITVPEKPEVVEEKKTELPVSPIKEDVVEVEQDNKENIPLPSLSLNAGDVHASLMEAIRQAGGSKKAKLRNIDNEMPKTAPNVIILEILPYLCSHDVVPKWIIVEQKCFNKPCIILKDLVHYFTCCKKILATAK